MHPMKSTLLMVGVSLLVAMLHIAPAQAEPVRVLAGTSWKIAGNPEAFITFENDRIGGRGGCNRFTAGYEELTDGAMTVSPIAATRMACAEAAMKFEHRFFAKLEKVRRFEIIDKRLVLRGGDLAVLLELEPDDHN